MHCNQCASSLSDTCTSAVYRPNRCDGPWPGPEPVVLALLRLAVPRLGYFAYAHGQLSNSSVEKRPNDRCVRIRHQWQSEAHAAFLGRIVSAVDSRRFRNTASLEMLHGHGLEALRIAQSLPRSPVTEHHKTHVFGQEYYNSKLL